MELLPYETWRDVVGYEKYYTISSRGNIRSKDRYVPHVSKNGKRTAVLHRAKDLKPHSSNRFQYYEISLYGDGDKEKKVKIHRLVAMAFIPNPHNLPQINHKNENRIDNRVENLEWCTAAYNIEYNNGRKRRDKTHSRPVVSIDENGNALMEFPNARAAGEFYGVSQGAIHKSISTGYANKQYKVYFKYKYGTTK